MNRYEELDGIRWSTLKAMAVSPKHYKFRTLRKDTDSPAKRFGRAVHTLILEPEHFAARHPLFPGAARRGKAWTEFQEKHPGSDPLIQSEADKVLAIAEAVMARPDARRHLESVEKEITLQWRDEGTGLDCKGRVDAAGHDGLVELKTCNPRDFAPNHFQWHALRMGYHGQVAYYTDGLRVTRPESGWGSAVIIVAESEPPYDVAVYRPTLDWMMKGQNYYQDLLRQVSACLAVNEWPGVCPGEEMELDVPRKKED